MRYVVIHDTDHDGIASAWMFKHYMNREDFVSNVPIEYFGVTAGKTDVPDLFPGDHVYIFDRSYSIETLLNISRQVAHVLVIDHHKTFLQEVARTYNNSGMIINDGYDAAGLVDIVVCVDNLEIIVNTKFAACALVSDYLGYKVGVSPNRVEDLWFIAYIADRDIWTFHLPMSREINLGIHTFPLEFETFDKMFNGEIMPEQCEERGMGIAAYKENLFDALLKVIPTEVEHTTLTCFEKMFELEQVDKDIDLPILQIAVVPCSFTPLVSDLGDTLLNDLNYDVAIIWHPIYYPSPTTQYSVRSKMDTSHLAKELGGGGHAQANGFRSVLSPEVIGAKYLRDLSK